MNNQHQNRAEDPLYDYLKDSLEDHQMSVDDKCWDNINQRISKKKMILPLRIVWTALATAACISLILVYINRNTTLIQPSITVLHDSIRIESIQLPISVVAEKSHALSSDTTTKHYTAKAHPIRKQNLSQNIINTKTDNIDHNTDQQTISTQENTQEGYISDEGEATRSSSSTITSRTKIDNLDMYKDKEVLVLAENNKSNNKWGVSASVSGSGSSSHLRTNFAEVRTAPAFFNQAAGPMIGSQSITDVKYAPPFSVGVAVRKSLNKTLGLETGLTYSYLSTSYKDVENQYYSTDLKLHYLGIPLNLVVNIWDITPQWRIYASTGVMAEKGLKSNFSQKIAQTDQKISKTENIKGIQWSVNASAGISYKFYQGWNAYIEPRVSYYFDNNQPLSIRTEKKTIVGINAGFRYDF